MLDILDAGRKRHVSFVALQVIVLFAKAVEDEGMVNGFLGPVVSGRAAHQLLPEIHVAEFFLVFFVHPAFVDLVGLVLQFLVLGFVEVCMEFVALETVGFLSVPEAEKQSEIAILILDLVDDEVVVLEEEVLL